MTETPTKAATSTWWDRTFGAIMTERLKNVLLPRLRWNQQVFGQLIALHLNSGDIWLDAGCGHRLLGRGPDIEQLEKALSGRAGLFAGTDVSHSALLVHQTLQHRVCSNLEQIPFQAGSFDVITCNMVVEHLAHPAAVFREFARVLRAGDLLLVHTPNRLNYLVAGGMIFKKLLPQSVIRKLVSVSAGRKQEDIFPTFYRANSRRGLRRLLADAGFAEVDFHYLVGPQPFFRFFAPLALFELLVMRLTMLKLFRPFATTIAGVYRKAA